MEIHLTKKKFRNFKQHEVEVIAQKINQFAYSVGIREPLQDLECMVLSNFLINEFPDFSVSELELVADKYSAGKLNFTDSHFQILSKDFLGKVLKSYRAYRNKELIKFHKEKEEIKAKENPVTKEEKEEIHKNFIETVVYKPYEKALKNENKIVLDDDVAFKLFVEMYQKGILSPSKEEVSYFKGLACEVLSKPFKTSLNRQELKNINNLIKKLKLVIENEGDMETTKLVQEKSASLYFNDWLNKKLKQKIDIKTLIK